MSIIRQHGEAASFLGLDFAWIWGRNCRIMSYLSFLKKRTAKYSIRVLGWRQLSVNSNQNVLITPVQEKFVCVSLILSLNETLIKFKLRFSCKNDDMAVMQNWVKRLVCFPTNKSTFFGLTFKVRFKDSVARCMYCKYATAPRSLDVANNF